MDHTATEIQHGLKTHATSINIKGNDHIVHMGSE